VSVEVQGPVTDGSARIENTILCSNVRVGEKAQVKDCEFGTGFEAKPGGGFTIHSTLLC
jgi:ADP-glucose pyrophosphorylase